MAPCISPTLLRGRCLSLSQAPTKLVFCCHMLSLTLPMYPCRILYNNVVSIFWNAFLSTLSHAPTIETTGVFDFVNQQVDNLPHPLHERAAEFADSLYSATRPLHEQAALFGDSFQLPESLRPMVCYLPPLFLHSTVVTSQC